jgi:putative hydrolase of the HAD superfamily
VGLRKPDPRIFRHALERLGGVAPERAVFLDDWAGNVAAAQRVGLHGVVVGDPPDAALAALERLLAA